MEKKKLRIEHKVIIENIYEVVRNLSDACLQVYHDVALTMFLVGDEYEDVDLWTLHNDDFYINNTNFIIREVAKDFKMKEKKLGWSVCTLDPCVELILLQCFFVAIQDHEEEDDMTCRQLLEYGLDKLGNTLSGTELYIR
ncbi:MAG: hypothetical protein Q4A15_10100 [Prevotellaceae bacterium]|nr:hypothetical protein [Prevotellaceae bacterium]